MICRLLPCCALLAMIGVPLVYAQSTTVDPIGNGQSQQNTLGCTDEMLASGVDCSQGQGQNSQMSPFGGAAIPMGQTALPGPVRLGSVPPENSVTSDQPRLREQQQQLRQLPPELPTEFQKFVGETTGQFLMIYGEDLFQRVPSTFAPSDQIPVPPNSCDWPGLTTGCGSRHLGPDQFQRVPAC